MANESFRNPLSALFARISQPAAEDVLPPTVRPATYPALEREAYVALEGEETTQPLVGCQTLEQYCYRLGVDPREALRG